METAEVYLLARDPRFQRFTYRIPHMLSCDVGDLVVLPFRNSFELGIVARKSEANHTKPLHPIAGRVLVKSGARASFGKLLLCLAKVNLCSPGDIFSQVRFGQARDMVTMFFFIATETAFPGS